MPFLALPFPNFDPIAIAIGPFAVRWYALAYIAGIVLGWLYARKILRTEKFWGGPAPISIPQFDDYVLWVTLGIILGGRTGYVLFYNLGYFVQHPLEMFQLWQGGMSFHGGFLGCVAAVLLFGWRNKVPVLSLGDVTCAVGADRAVPRPARQLHQQRIVGPDDRRAVGLRVPDRRAAAAASEPALRGGAGGAAAVRRADADDPPRRLAAAGPDHRHLCHRLRLWRGFSANSSASRTRSSDSCGEVSPWACCCRFP